MTTPRPIAEMIADRFIGHSVDLLRLSAGEQRVVLKMLGQLQREIEGKIMASDVDERTIFQERRLTALWKTVNELTTKYYAKISATHQDSLGQIAEMVSDHTKTLTNAVVGVPLLTVGAPLQVLRALADDAIVLGRPAQEWWSQQKDNLRGRFQNTIRQGIYSGETLGELLRRVRGTRERQFRDGIFSMSTREASALIRTSVQSIANAARYETYQANEDVIAGQSWLTTLDGRACPRCQALSGESWSLSGEKLDGTTLDFPGPPPLHFQDRCSLLPALKSWEQLAHDAKGNEKLARKLDRIEKKLGPGTQSSLDGQISADINYSDWLKTRSEAEQKEILGPGKFSLFKKGKIGLTDLVDQSGRPLSLKELRASVA